MCLKLDQIKRIWFNTIWLKVILLYFWICNKKFTSIFPTEVSNNQTQTLQIKIRTIHYEGSGYGEEINQIESFVRKMSFDCSEFQTGKWTSNGRKNSKWIDRNIGDQSWRHIWRGIFAKKFTSARLDGVDLEEQDEDAGEVSHITG